MLFVLVAPFFRIVNFLPLFLMPLSTRIRIHNCCCMSQAFSRNSYIVYAFSYSETEDYRIKETENGFVGI